MPRHSGFHRRLLVAMLWVVTHPRLVLSGSLLVLLGCIILAYFRLGLSTNQDELFSSKVAFFKTYVNVTRNFPENQASYVIIEPINPASPPPVKKWIAIADAITDRLARDTVNVKAVDSHVPLEQLGNQAILFDSPANVKKEYFEFERLALPFRQTSFINRFLGRFPLERLFNSVNPSRATGPKLDAQTADFVAMISRGLIWVLTDKSKPIRLGDQVPDLAKLGQTDPSTLGYYYVEDQEKPEDHLLLIRVYEHSNFNKRNGLADSIEGIRNDIREASAGFTDFKVDITGRPALEADEMSTTDHDARISEIAALSAVFIGLVLLLRSIWIAVAAELALLVGIGWTFGWATVSVHRLNLLSLVFLIALTGIGMDYLIQVLTRYRREAALRSSPRGIWTGVFKYVAAPINTACLGAAGAFLVSIFTNFSGAAELGTVAGGGLLLCLLTGYLILPPLLTLFPAKARAIDAERHSDLPPEPAVQTSASKKLSRLRNLWLAPPVVWALLLIAGIPFARQAQFNPSLLQMQSQSLPSVKLVQKLQTWSAAVVTTGDDKQPAAQVRQLRAVRKAVETLPTVASTDSILTAYDNADWLKQQNAKAIEQTDYEPVQPDQLPELADDIRKLAAAARASKPPFAPMADSLDALANAISSGDPKITCSRLSAWQQLFIGQIKDLLAKFRPPPFDPEKVPASLRSHLIGQDGHFVLYINPKQDLWVQSNLHDFVTEVEKRVRSVPNAPPVTGVAVDVYHSTSDIERSFYEAAGYALGLIFLLVLVDLRNISQTLLAISVLAMGLPMLVALMGLFHVDWNFANFFGLPILIGAGHEYGVFMVHRYNEARSDPHRRWRAWDVSDKALLLCGYVTSVSFGFFWLLGHHEGLKSLGLVMALGTTCIYLATLCVLRPLLLWKLSRRTVQAVPAVSPQRLSA
jgi:predicted RND superfamily exporter protein